MFVRRILYPVDFSQQCSDFGPYVAEVARRFDAELTLLHAVDSASLTAYGMDPGMSMAVAYAEGLSERRKKQLDEFQLDQFANLRVKRVTEAGDTAAVICRYAMSNGVDLIMMPTHGYGPFRRLLLGSVTAKVLHDSDCLVWTNAHQEGAAAARKPVFREILCSVDVTPESLPLLRSAAVIAQQLGGELRLVHAIPAIDAATEYSRRALGTSEAMYDSTGSEIEELQRAAGTKAELCIETGSVARVIRSAALRHHSDLVIVGRGHLNESFGALRTNAYAVIHDCPCPVLSVFAGPRRETLLSDDSVALAQCLARR